MSPRVSTETWFSERPEGNPRLVEDVALSRARKVHKWSGDKEPGYESPFGFHSLAGDKKVERVKKSEYRGCSATPLSAFGLADPCCTVVLPVFPHMRSKHESSCQRLELT